jgi:hypothetical protein
MIAEIVAVKNEMWARPNETACWTTGGVEQCDGREAREAEGAQKQRALEIRRCAPKFGYAYIPRSLMVCATRLIASM